MQNNTKSALFRARLTVLLISVAVILILSLAVCLIALGTRKTDSREEIAAKIETVGKSPWRSVADYIYRFGIRDFERAKLKTVERYYEQYYYTGSLPSSYALAKETALFFLEHFYDELDLSDRASVTAALANCYIAAVGDRYGFYRLPEEYAEYGEDMSGERVGIGVEIQLDNENNTILVTSVLGGSPAEAAGILEGDYIVGVGSVRIGDIGAAALTDAIRGTEGTEVLITVKRGDGEIAVSIVRRLFTERTVTLSLDAGKIAYIKIRRFKDNTDEQLAEALEAARTGGAVGIIFDLRDNPGGYLDAVLNAVEMLVPAGVRLASYKYAGGEEKVYTSKLSDRLDIPCVVLCNESTASAGELFTAAMRDYAKMGLISAKTVGMTTYGKGVMQSTVTRGLGGAALTLTVAYYNPPSDVNYEGVGITPDIEIEAESEQLTRAYTELMLLIANQGLQN